MDTLRTLSLAFLRNCLPSPRRRPARSRVDYSLHYFPLRRPRSWLVTVRAGGQVS